MEKTINRILLDSYDAAQHLDASELLNFLCKSIQPVVPFDSAAVCTIGDFGDGKAGLLTAQAFNICAKFKLEMRKKYVDEERFVAAGSVREFFSRDTVLRDAWLRPGQSTIEFVGNVADENLRKYATVTGSINTLVLVSRSRSSAAFSSFSLWRGRRRAHFSQQDDALGTLLIPHLFRALDINRSLNVLGKESGAFAIADRSGIVQFASPSALDLIRRQWPDWHSTFLPSTMMDTIRTQGTYRGRHFSVDVDRRDTLLFLRFAPVEHLEQLTPTENRVAQYLCQGSSYKKIAMEMACQPATVRNHAHNIYQKLGVSGRWALAAAMRKAPKNNTAPDQP